MVNDLKNISDEDAINVANILLKTSTSDIYNFIYEKITRQNYDPQHGVDAEESISVYFEARVKSEVYKKHGWKDEKIKIDIICQDQYHDYPYFVGYEKKIDDKSFSHKFISNHIAAVKFLQSKNLI